MLGGQRILAGRQLREDELAIITDCHYVGFIGAGVRERELGARYDGTALIGNASH